MLKKMSRFTFPNILTTGKKFLKKKVYNNIKNLERNLLTNSITIGLLINNVGGKKSRCVLQ